MTKTRPPQDSTIDLAALLHATAERDATAFKQLYDATSSHLFAVIVRIVGGRDTAADVLQEVYLRIWTSAAGYRAERGTPMAWMTTIARNRALDWRRHLGNTVSAGDPAELELADVSQSGPMLEPGGSVGRNELKRCLAQLPVPQRHCVILAYMAGYSHEELADRFGRPLGTVKSWIRRGLAALKKCLEP